VCPVPQTVIEIGPKLIKICPNLIATCAGTQARCGGERAGVEIGTRHAIWRGIVAKRTAVIDPVSDRTVWIVEDEPAATLLATDLCEAAGVSSASFRDPLSFLTALRSGPPPDAVILDWRLEREVSAGLFLTMRHHHPRLPVVCWTGSAAGELPAVIRNDPWTVVVEKGSDASTFEDALSWALDPSNEPLSGGSASG
jgi:CheY-like chemotaxis protein